MKLTLLIFMCTVQTAHSATQPLDRPVVEYPTCVTIPGPLHQVSYSCHDPHRCTPCRTCHLHTTSQANAIHPGFVFKPLQVNDSSQSNQETDHLISQNLSMCR
jgi:hypothetical protein